MSPYELSVANEAGVLTFDQAAEYAYRMASRWGGSFGVYLSGDDKSHQVLGGAPESLREAKDRGLTKLGGAHSIEAGAIEWEWADDSDRPAPPDPFDLPRPKPPQLAVHLEPDTQELLRWMLHVMAVQTAFKQSNLPKAYRLLTSEPDFLQPGAVVWHGPYLQNAEQRGMVDAEISRLQSTVEAARAAWTGPGAEHDAEAIINGRSPARAISPGR